MAYRILVDNLFTAVVVRRAQAWWDDTTARRKANTCEYGGPEGRVLTTYFSEATVVPGSVIFREVDPAELTLQEARDDGVGGLRFWVANSDAKDGVGVINYSVGTYQFRFPAPCREGSNVVVTFEILEPFQLSVLGRPWETEYVDMANMLDEGVVFTRQMRERWERLLLKCEYCRLLAAPRGNHSERMRQLELSLGG